MSHFYVLVRVPANLAGNGDEDAIHAAVSKLMLPYKESGCGDNDPDELRQYLTFHDTEDEYLTEYKTDTTPVFIEPNVTIHTKYSDRFRTFDAKTFSSEYICPDGWTTDDAYPLARLYATFESFMADYCGYKTRDEQTGRYGYWQNPNKKWDWFSIGGRWDNELPRKGGEKVNIVPLYDFDWSAIHAEMDQRFSEFAPAYLRVIETGKDTSGFMEGPRSNALSFGLLACKDEAELTEDDKRQVLIPWERQPNRFDVWQRVTIEGLQKFYTGFFPAYALLDASGWHAKGDMGWFGMDSHTPERNPLALAATAMESLKTGDQTDWLVGVDCHI